jgi:hypothetical protein
MRGRKNTYVALIRDALEAYYRSRLIKNSQIGILVTVFLKPASPVVLRSAAKDAGSQELYRKT